MIRTRTVLGTLFLWMALAAGAPASEAPAPGAELDLGAYAGKVVVVDFWASWCQPCRRSFPWLNDMQARYGERGLVILGINTDPEAADAERFLERTPAHFRILRDPAGKLAARYRLAGMPSSLVFGRDGALVATHVGFLDARKAEREAELVKILDGAAR